MSQPINQAFILAAGLGTRLGELTRETPKPLVDVGGQSPLVRTIGLLTRFGVQRIVINTHHQAEKIAEAIAPLNQNGAIVLVHETTRLETGGGLKNALPYLNDAPFFVLGGDIVWHEEVYPLLPLLANNFNPQTMDGLLALVQHATHPLLQHKQGDFALLPSGKLCHHKNGAVPAYIYGVAAVMQKSIVQGFQEEHFPLLQAFLRAESLGRLFGVPYRGPWVDMGTPEGLAYARKMMAHMAASA